MSGSVWTDPVELFPLILFWALGATFALAVLCAVGFLVKEAAGAIWQAYLAVRREHQKVSS